jgi:hypothetical protein
MTATRYDVLSARTYKDRDGNERTSFTKLGVAFPMRDKDGFSLSLEAVPAPQDGVYKLLLMPPKEREERGEPIRTSSGTHYQRGGARPAARDELDDDVPFAAPVL